MTNETTGSHAANALMIPDDVLEAHGARRVRLAKGEILFEQGHSAMHFHIVSEGRIKMSTSNDDGREFVQGYFADGESFGEPPFFTRTHYPASAIAMARSSVWRCAYDPFLSLLRENPDVHLRLTRILSGRLIYKAMMLSEIAVEEAEHRLATLIDYLRRNAGVAGGSTFRVPLTRQQLADMTGLRVETVIRTVKGMESRGLLRIDEGTVVWRGPDQQISEGGRRRERDGGGERVNESATMSKPVTPQRRHRALVSLSHDHHHGLVAAVRMKQGSAPYRDADPAVAIARLWSGELEGHFAKEEAILFARPYSPEVTAMIARALEDHAAMRALVARAAEGSPDVALLRAFGELLERHIRFEERELFPAIQGELGDEELAALGAAMAAGDLGP